MKVSLEALHMVMVTVQKVCRYQPIDDECLNKTQNVIDWPQKRMVLVINNMLQINQTHCKPLF